MNRWYGSSSLRSSARYDGHRQQHGELGELGRLQVQRAEVEAEHRLGAAHVQDVHQRDERQQHQRHAVEEPRLVLPPVVVERHHHDHRQHRGDEEDLLAGDEEQSYGSSAGDFVCDAE